MDERTTRRRPRVTTETRDRAKKLRTEATFPERLLWSRLRANQVGGLHMRRQHPVGPYILDFLCADAKLVIELDGRSHDDREQYDAARTAYLQGLGMRVVRFSDDEVLNNLNEVVRRIAYEVGLEV